MPTKLKSQFQELNKIAHYVRPDQEWVASNKQKLMQQIHNSTAFEKKETSFFDALEFWLPRHRILVPLRVAFVFLIIIGMTVGSWIAGVSASNDSLPGEVLYKVKIATENTQLALTSALSSGADKAENKAKLQLQFAGRRSKEVKGLVAQKTAEASVHVPETIQKLKDSIKDAQDNVKVAKESHPEKAIVLAQSVTDTTTVIVQDLKEVAQQGTPAEAHIVKEVVETSKIVNDTGLQVIEGVLDDKNVTDGASKEQIKQLVEQKIDTIVQKVEENKVAAEEVKQLSAVATSTLDVNLDTASTSLKIGISQNGAITTASSTINLLPVKTEVEKVGESIKKADAVVDEVKVLLADNQVKEALQKAKTLNTLTSETQQAIVDTKNKVNTVVLPTLAAPDAAATASSSLKIQQK